MSRRANFIHPASPTSSGQWKKQSERSAVFVLLASCAFLVRQSRVQVLAALAEERAARGPVAELPRGAARPAEAPLVWNPQDLLMNVPAGARAVAPRVDLLHSVF